METQYKRYRCPECGNEFQMNENSPYWLPKAEAHTIGSSSKVCRGKYQEVLTPNLSTPNC